MSAPTKIEFIPWHDIPDNIFPQEKLRNWLSSLAADYNKQIGRITFMFCSDEYMLQMNQQFMGHDYHTDILTFSEDQLKKDVLRADILISWERIQDNAKIFEVPQEEELLRVMAHGLLHLIGFKDKSEKDKLIMRMAETRAIDIWKEEQ